MKAEFHAERASPALAAEGPVFDIVSAGELQRVIAAGGRSRLVIFSGVAKRHDEIALALAHNIFCFNIEVRSGVAP